MKSLSKFRGLFITGIFLLLFAGTQAVWALQDKAGFKVLFVGNSLTYTNNLPALLVQFAEQKQHKITAHVLAYPDYALEDHLNEDKLRAMIDTGKYDFVIIQQGPSSGTAAKDILIRDALRIKELCRKNNAQLAIYMVWPAKNNYTLFDKVIQNYTRAAQESGAILCPVGQYWKAYIDSTADYSYYGPDGFHPSLKGSAAAAAIIYRSLSDQ